MLHGDYGTRYNNEVFLEHKRHCDVFDKKNVFYYHQKSLLMPMKKVFNVSLYQPA